MNILIKVAAKVGDFIRLEDETFVEGRITGCLEVIALWLLLFPLSAEEGGLFIIVRLLKLCKPGITALGGIHVLESNSSRIIISFCSAF